jgi:hypothetical protein
MAAFRLREAVGRDAIALKFGIKDAVEEVSTNAVLADDRCDNGVLEVAFARSSTARKGLDAALPNDSLGTFDRAVKGTWVGRFHSDYGRFHETFLEVSTISNLSVVPFDFSTSYASPISTTVDEVVKHPKEFNHKIAYHRSEYMSDGTHGSMIFECNSSGVQTWQVHRRPSLSFPLWSWSTLS